MEGDHVCLSQGRCEAKDMGIGIIRDSRSHEAERLAERAFNRGTVYELLSHCFGEPVEEFLQFLTDGEFLKHMSRALRTHAYYKEGIIVALHALIEKAKDAGIDGISREYGQIVSPERNLLYEGNYHHPFNSFEEMADIAGFYRAFGFDSGSERPDHLCLELEFMRILSLKEAMALKEGGQERFEITVNTERDFLSSHLGRWTEALVDITEGLYFYNDLSRFLKEWVEMECALHSVKCDRIFYVERIGEDSNDLCLKEEERDERF